MLKNSNKKHVLTIFAIVLFSFSVSIFVLTPFSFTNFAAALTGNYSKTTGSNLDITDWNNLDNDFVAKSGDTMAGPLNMGNNQITNVADPTADNQAVNRGSMNSAILAAVAAASMTDTSGSPLKVICGSTPTNTWQNDTLAPNTVYQLVDISSFGFASTPVIFTSLYGNNYLFKAQGTNSIYFPSSNNFTVFVTHLSETIDKDIVQSWGWSLNWCALGN